METKIKLPAGLRLLRKLNFPRKLGILERLYGKRLSRLGTGFGVCANGVNWKLNLEDVGHRWMIYGYYEGGVAINYAAQKLKGGGVYVDSGANIGQWIVYLSQIPRLKTFAFEPVHSEKAWLKQCLNNYPAWDVEVIDTALSSQADKLKIQCAGSRSTFHTQWYKTQENEVIEVDVDRLDAILESKGVSQIEFWKLDVEGFEYEALVGAQKYLEKKKIKCVYFECHPLNFEKILEYLNTLDYGVYRLSKKGILDSIAIAPLSTENFVAEPR